jgi:hypothetical protein
LIGAANDPMETIFMVISQLPQGESEEHRKRLSSAEIFPSHHGDQRGINADRRIQSESTEFDFNTHSIKFRVVFGYFFKTTPSQ